MNTRLSEKDRTEPSAPSLRRIPEWLFLDKWLPWLVLVAGLFVTCLLWQHEKQIAAQKMEENFEFRVSRDVDLIEQRMKTYVQVMRGVQGVFAASGTIHRNQFRDYVDTLQLKQAIPASRVSVLR